MHEKSGGTMKRPWVRHRPNHLLYLHDLWSRLSPTTPESSKTKMQVISDPSSIKFFSSIPLMKSEISYPPSKHTKSILRSSCLKKKVFSSTHAGYNIRTSLNSFGGCSYSRHDDVRIVLFRKMNILIFLSLKKNGVVLREGVYYPAWAHDYIRNIRIYVIARGPYNSILRLWDWGISACDVWWAWRIEDALTNSKGKWGHVCNPPPLLIWFFRSTKSLAPTTAPENKQTKITTA
jgi:hypothetical protein